MNCSLTEDHREAGIIRLWDCLVAAVNPLTNLFYCTSKLHPVSGCDLYINPLTSLILHTNSLVSILPLYVSCTTINVIKNAAGRVRLCDRRAENRIQVAKSVWNLFQLLKY